MILSVGYRVSSKRGTQFRIWATKVLKEHIIKGYTLNYDRYKEIEEKFHKQTLSYELLRSRIEKYLSTAARRNVVNTIDDKIDELRKDFEVFKKSITKNKRKNKLPKNTR